ncbi:MAG: low temperature requirement protein A [Kutzneria sp.]|nr:low temperature requirement protein A [Kutzneria sp.]
MHPTPREKRVTWAELFFDLVFVFAVTELSALLREDHSWPGVARALVAFVPVYWGWVGMSVHTNTHDVDNPVDRFGIFAAGLAGLFMALAVPGAYHERGLLFGASYYALRLVLAALVFRGRQMMLGPFSVPVLVSGPLLVVGGLLDATPRVLLWGLAALVDLATPTLARRRISRIRFHAGHLPERFGLFLIIALGESIVSVGGPAATAAHIDAMELGAVAESFALACALWWVYFNFAADAIRHSMATTTVQNIVIRHVLSYAHLVFVGGIIAVAVGLAESVAHPAGLLGTGVAGLLFGGCALYLATFGYTRWRMFSHWSTTRLSAAAVVLALMPVAARLPALAALGTLLVVVSALNVVEHLMANASKRSEPEPVAEVDL